MSSSPPSTRRHHLSRSLRPTEVVAFDVIKDAVDRPLYIQVVYLLPSQGLRKGSYLSETVSLAPTPRRTLY